MGKGGAKKLTVAEIDETNQAEEASPIKPEEQEYLDYGLDALTADQRARMENVAPFDALQIVRGYQTYKPRKEETEKAFKMIQGWRDSVSYHTIFDKIHPEAQRFHTEIWKEQVYGYDKHGHMIISFKFQAVDVNEVADMDDDVLSVVIAQKLGAYTWLKTKKQRETGVQRYKNIFIIDMKGAGAGLLSGKRRNSIKKVMDFASDYFPESVWKIYIINTPFMLRGGYAMAKPWIHPVTQAKINIIGKPSDAFDLLVRNDGCKPSDLPDILGGTHPGKNCFELIKEAVADRISNGAAEATSPRPRSSKPRATPPGTLL